MHSIFLPPPGRSTSTSTVVHPPSSSPFKSRLAPIPFAQWPAWARTLAKFRRESDTGLGDTIAHLIGDTRSERFKKWFQRKFGRSCGCTERQRWLNQKFPYSNRNAAA